MTSLLLWDIKEPLTASSRTVDLGLNETAFEQTSTHPPPPNGSLINQLHRLQLPHLPISTNLLRHSSTAPSTLPPPSFSLPPRSFPSLAHNQLHPITMLLLGLTGSIATGKSTVSNLLSASPYNLPVIDADVIARQVVEPGTKAYGKIVGYFGSTTPDLLLPAEPPEAPRPSGSTAKAKPPTSSSARPLNRPALGRRVFGDSPERKRDRAVLNSIVHPAVRMEIYKQLLRHYLSGCWAVVLDVPLLFESGLDALCGTVMVVAVSDPEIQMQRLRGRDSHLTEEDARNRVLSQGDVREKARRCEARGERYGVVVWNDGGREELKKDVERYIRGIQGGSPRWWAWLLLLVPPLAGLVGVWTYWRNLRAIKAWKEGELREKAKL